MFSDDEIMEVMAAEIGEVRANQSRSLLTAVGDEERVLQRHVFHRTRFSDTRPGWPEQETYPSIRHRVTT